MKTTRREFLAHGLGTAGLVATSWSLPGFLTRTAAAAMRGGGERILVIVQMSGGNDGLNTVVPYRDDEYHKARPTLRITPERALKLNDTLGLHPDMGGFKRLFDDGLLSVVTNIGYPNPDRSHFRSMDIWHTACMDPEHAKDGWLGRVVDQKASQNSGPLALHLDDGSLPLALKTQGQAVPSITGIEAFRLQEGADELQRLIAAPRGAKTEGNGAAAKRAASAAFEDLLFVQRVAVSSCASAKRIEQVNRDAAASASYPNYRLATQLKQIAQLIGADFGAGVYYTSLGGFDTHARQVLAHGPLLRELADSVAAFFDDLKQRGLAERVTLMTFSEFGRRVKENGSQGTDHGAAAPLFVAGPACKAGVLGGAPDLKNLDDGDVRHKLDFRRVYAALLQDWLQINPRPILGQTFEPLAVLRGAS